MAVRDGRGSYTRTVDELERVELSAILDFFAAAPDDVADELDLAVLELDEAAAFSIGAEPKPLLFNRVLGLTDHHPLRELEQWSASRDCPLAVSTLDSTELEGELRGRGYERSRTSVKFRRDASPAGKHTTSAILARRIEAAGAAGADVFAVETADRVDGEPGPSFRNVVRAGFEEAYRQQWWLRA